MASAAAAEEDSITLVFEVDDDSVDAYTLASALTAFADLALAVDRRINPGTEIGIEVVGLARGSVRAKVRRVQKGTPGFFADGARNIFWGVISSLIVMWLFQSTHLKVDIRGGDVTVAGDDETVTVHLHSEDSPDEVASAVEVVKHDPAVRQSGRNLFRSVERDAGVKSLGLERAGHRPITIPQSEFARLSSEGLPDEVPQRRKRVERATLIILKPSLHIKPRKWSFEWNGVPISAKISDDAFLATMRNRGFLFGYGDALEVEIAYEQDFDPTLGLYKNDSATFTIVRVLRHIPSA